MPPHNPSKEARTRGPDLESPQNRAPKSLGRKWRRADLGSEHRAQMLHLARECGRAALTMHEVAEVFGVNMDTIYRWAAEDAGFDEALRLNKDLADERVERALYMKATGFSFRSEKIFNGADGVVRVPTIEYVQPDMAAIAYWLGNRQRGKWQSVNRIQMDGDVNVNVKDEAADPRKLAMAILATLREAVEAPMIEHEEAVADAGGTED